MLIRIPRPKKKFLRRMKTEILLKSRKTGSTDVKIILKYVLIYRIWRCKFHLNDEFSGSHDDEYEDGWMVDSCETDAGGGKLLWKPNNSNFPEDSHLLDSLPQVRVQMLISAKSVKNNRVSKIKGKFGFGYQLKGIQLQFLYYVYQISRLVIRFLCCYLSRLLEPETPIWR